MKLTRLIFCMLSVLLLHVGHAQNPRAAIQQDKNLSGANYLAYPAPEQIRYSPAPKGYKPFYISTYARHGSRFHLNRQDYTSALAPLEKADSAKVLSNEGKEVMQKISRVLQLSEGRLGELTPLGARQHRGIAERMYRNFPEIFTKDIDVDARSTYVPRCILSMTAGCLQLKAMNPKLRISNDASRHDMYYMNYDDKYLAGLRYSEKQETIRAFKQRHVHPERLMKVLFTDSTYVKDNIRPDDLMQYLFFVAMNMQSIDDKELDIYNIFTAEECYELWSCWNVLWYMEAGNTPLTEGMMPYKEVNLLRNILDTADSCIVRKGPSATLRYGHESCLLPLAVLMELGDCGYVTEDMETLADHWQCYRYFPMASNIQLVFYRKSGNDDILVRVLLNEKEVCLPIGTDCAPFYHWRELSEYYRSKLSGYSPVGEEI